MKLSAIYNYKAWISYVYGFSLFLTAVIPSIPASAVKLIAFLGAAASIARGIGDGLVKATTQTSGGS